MCIEDVVIKSKGYKEHLADLQKTLECMRKHGLKINPNKCAFGVSAGQFSIYESKIEVDQKSISVIDKIEAPSNRKEL
jgi:hypothetical protein